MIPSKAFSVKLSEEERSRLKEMSQLLGCTDGKAIRDALDAIYLMIHEPEIEEWPEMVEFAQLALRRKQKHPANPHEKHSSRARTPNHSKTRRPVRRI